MKAKPLHQWDVSPKAASDLQRHLAPMVSRTNEIKDPPRYIAGGDSLGRGVCQEVSSA